MGVILSRRREREGSRTWQLSTRYGEIPRALGMTRGRLSASSVGRLTTRRRPTPVVSSATDCRRLPLVAFAFFAAFATFSPRKLRDRSALLVLAVWPSSRLAVWPSGRLAVFGR